MQYAARPDSSTSAPASVFALSGPIRLNGGDGSPLGQYIPRTVSFQEP